MVRGIDQYKKKIKTLPENQQKKQKAMRGIDQYLKLAGHPEK